MNRINTREFIKSQLLATSYLKFGRRKVKYSRQCFSILPVLDDQANIRGVLVNISGKLKSDEVVELAKHGIFEGKRSDDGIVLVMEDSAWIGERGFSLFTDSVLLDREVDDWALLLLDSLFGHKEVRFIKRCLDQGYVPVYVAVGHTGYTQPLDRTFNSEFKRLWDCFCATNLIDQAASAVQICLFVKRFIELFNSQNTSYKKGIQKDFMYQGYSLSTKNFEEYFLADWDSKVDNYLNLGMRNLPSDVVSLSSADLKGMSCERVLELKRKPGPKPPIFGLAQKQSLTKKEISALYEQLDEEEEEVDREELLAFGRDRIERGIQIGQSVLEELELEEFKGQPSYWAKLWENRESIHQKVTEKVLESHTRFVSEQNEKVNEEKDEKLTTELDHYLDDDLVNAHKEKQFSRRGYYKSGAVVKKKKKKKKKVQANQQTIKNMWLVKRKEEEVKQVIEEAKQQRYATKTKPKAQISLIQPTVEPVNTPSNEVAPMIEPVVDPAPFPMIRPLEPLKPIDREEYRRTKPVSPPRLRPKIPIAPIVSPKRESSEPIPQRKKKKQKKTTQSRISSFFKKK